MRESRAGSTGRKPVVVTKWRGKSSRPWGSSAAIGASLFSEEEAQASFPPFNYELTESILAAIAFELAFLFVENVRGF